MPAQKKSPTAMPTANTATIIKQVVVADKINRPSEKLSDGLFYVQHGRRTLYIKDTAVMKCKQV